MNMHETIREAFRQSGLSTNKLAKLAKLNYSPLYRFLHEGASLRLDSVEAVCGVLGLELVRVKRSKVAK